MADAKLDQRRLIEVFENLLDNAAKFMGEQASPSVEVGIDETGPQPVIFVRDNGLGIDPRHAPKLVGLFEKLHPETEGTGIELALVKRNMEDCRIANCLHHVEDGQASFPIPTPSRTRNPRLVCCV